ncbi:MAG: DUF4153 domain-containing protein, partial [Sphingomicrobium sp.]
GGVSPLRQAGATFVVIATISFVLTVEQRRWTWSLAFALGWGAVVALVGWFTASYNQQGEIFEWPFLSGLFAVLLAAPLFQTVRDEGAWRFPYAKLHGHAWTDAVIGAASLAFVGIAFLLAWLIAMLFDLIGIDLIKELLQKEWFGWMLAGFAFGSALGLLRERDALVATLQRLVMVVLGVLAPVLAVALLLFLASLPFTGLTKLWDSSVPATPLMLLAGAGAILLANAVIGNGDDDRATSRVLRIASQALVLCVLPLAIIAAVSLSQRIGQYGWTPERIWGVVAVAIAVGYGLAGWWSVARGRVNFDDLLRPLQTKMAIGLCGLALFLALPILDFGAISANSQMARFASGKVDANEFDWKAMAFDFGPAGRERLAEIAKRGPPDQRKLAATALAAKDRHQVEEQVRQTDSAATLDTRLRIIPEGTALPAGLRESIAATRYCRVGSCVVTMVDQRRAVIAGPLIKDDNVETALLMPNAKGVWQQDIHSRFIAKPPFRPDVSSAPVELRTVERRQLYIDGKPVGDAFE